MPSHDEILKSLEAVIDPELRRRSSSSAWSARSSIQDDGVVDVVVSLTTPGCPIRSHFEQAVVDRRRRARGRDAASSVGFDVLSDQEKAEPAAEARPRRAARGRARPGQERDLRRLRQGRRRQVDDDRQPRRGADRRGPDGRRARLRRLRLLDPAHARRQRPPGGQRRAQDHAARVAGGVKVMSIGFFVEENAAVVWRGPMLHKAIQQFLEDVDWGELDYLLLDLPPGTGDVSMTLAQLLPQAQVRDRHDAAAGRADGRRAAPPRWPHKVDLEIARRDREHVRLHHARRRALHDLRRGRRPGRWPTSSTCRCSARCRSTSRCASTPTPACRSWSSDPDDPAAQAIRQAARGIIAMIPRELPVLQVAGGADGPPPISSPEPAGMTLPMA